MFGIIFRICIGDLFVLPVMEHVGWLAAASATTGVVDLIKLQLELRWSSMVVPSNAEA